MEASSLPPELVRELAALRRRAYALDADIGDDPSAQRRLAQLEAALHTGADSHGAAEPRSMAAAADVATGSAKVGSLTTQEPMRHPVGSRSILRRWSATRVAAVFGVAVVVIWAAGAVLTALRDAELDAVSATGQERQDLIDQVDLAALGMTGARLQPFAAFRDLWVWSATSSAGARCLLVGADEQGVIDLDCSSGALEPALEVQVGLEVRPALVGDLPIGSVVRFSMHGGDVSVGVAEASGEIR